MVDMLMNSKPKSKKVQPVTDPTAALRQQRRRDLLKKAGGQKVTAVLNKAQGEKLKLLLAEGYAKNKSEVLTKGLDHAYEEHIKRGKEPKSK